jgi:NAD(P)-dependent dehydrogenase (short-subunit alcohol dehydrogenase family)
MSMLAGKSIVVTGGNSGIGKAIVLAAAAEGANVVVDYRMHPEYTAEVIAAAGRAGGRAVGVEADVSRIEDLHQIIQTAVENSAGLTFWSATRVSKPARRCSKPAKPTSTRCWRSTSRARSSAPSSRRSNSWRKAAAG